MGVVSSAGFVFAIARASCDFLYLNNEYMILTKAEKKNKKEKKELSMPAPHERILKGPHDDVSDVINFCIEFGNTLDRICL